MTYEEFDDWIANAKFEREISSEYSDVDFDIDDRDKAFSWLSVNSKTILPNGEAAEIINWKKVSWLGSINYRISDEYEFFNDYGDNERWIMHGITLVDDDGVIIIRGDLDENIPSDSCRRIVGIELSAHDILSLMPKKR